MKPLYFADKVINKTLDNSNYKHTIKVAQNYITVFDNRVDSLDIIKFHYHENFRGYEYMTFKLNGKTYFYINENDKPDYYYTEEDDKEIDIDKDTFFRLQEEFINSL